MQILCALTRAGEVSDMTAVASHKCTPIFFFFTSVPKVMCCLVDRCIEENGIDLKQRLLSVHCCFFSLHSVELSVRAVHLCS